MGKGVVRWFSAVVLSVAIIAAGVGPGLARGFPVPAGGDAPTYKPGTQSLDNQLSDATEAALLALDSQFTLSIDVVKLPAHDLIEVPELFTALLPGKAANLGLHARFHPVVVQQGVVDVDEEDKGCHGDKCAG